MKTLPENLAGLCAAAAFMGLLSIKNFGAEADTTAPRGTQAKGNEPTIVGEEIAVITQAPFVPPPIKRSHATKVIVTWEVKEVGDVFCYLRLRLPDSCPRHERIEAALPEAARSNVSFTLITFDSERDTPAVLSAFRRKHQLTVNWNLLRTEPDDVFELAALLGVKFKKDALGQFAHSNIITVLNAKGEIVFQEVGLNRDPAATVASIQKLLAEGTN